MRSDGLKPLHENLNLDYLGFFEREIILENIITSNAIYKPVLGYRQGRKPYPCIRQTKEGYSYKALIKSQIEEIENIQGIITCLVSTFWFLIPEKLFYTSSGSIRKRYDCVNIVKPAEDAIVEKTKELNKNWDDSLTTTMHIHKVPVKEKLPCLIVKHQFYGNNKIN